ncbi:fungal-specific transcription factor domain protein [Rhizoctonia solani AG-3 Rhs1AP]|uniref:Fungal-specific transcription factor domain protein n=1 Tax=Rhizoctonia solani AG-3 Rhs1AP TaxID=1086054 RepID=X8J1X5_9AGAM|nr:fungal-specific transcription factor domain protein [Rhizoctonia solani AG-3 Rhs1AP]
MIESAPLLALSNTPNPRPAREDHENTDIMEHDEYSGQGRETRTSQLSQDHLAHQTAGYHPLSALGTISYQDLSPITHSGMEEPGFDFYSSFGSTGLAANDSEGFYWGSSGTGSLFPQSFATPLSDRDIMDSLSNSEWTFGLPLNLPSDDIDMVQPLTASYLFNSSQLSQPIAFNFCPISEDNNGMINPVDTMAISQAFNQTSLELPTSNSQMTAAQASLFGALLSLGEPLANDKHSASSFRFSPGSTGFQFQPTNLERSLDYGVFRENDDPEGIQTIMCGELVLDRNVESNSLPFVLHSYAEWMRRTLFDPSRAAARSRDYIIRHFAESKQSRSRTILIANIFRSIATNPTFDLSYLPKLSALRKTIQETLADAARRKTNPSREIQARESIRALEQTLELFAASRSEPLDICLELMRKAAPVFRRACLEPMNQLVHLPSILMHSSANMRHYPVMDLYFSIVTGLPTNLQYDTSLRSPVDTSVLYIDNHLGLSWLYGQPDSITLILARTNSLYQDFGANVDVKTIQEIEQDIRSFKAISGSSPDPSLLVVRLVVQECWRQVAYIYLYMTLCGADALDVRVRTAQQRLMKLIGDTKPAPALDMHLAPCLGIAGVVTHQSTERKAMLLRLQGLPECYRPDSCFGSCIRILEELWRQTDTENRPAKWVDFRLATLRVLGMQ